MGIKLPKFSRRSAKAAEPVPASDDTRGEDLSEDLERARYGLVRLGLFIALMGVTGILATGFFFQQQAASTVTEARRHEIRLTAENLADRIGALFAAQAERMDLLARDPVIIELASRRDPRLIAAKEAELGYLFPEAVRVRILPPGLDEVDMNASPPLSYAALDMLRQAETHEEPPPAEVHLFGTPQQHINMVRRILNDSGRRIVGHLMVSFPLPLLQNAMNAPRLPQGYGEIWQVTSKGAPLTLASRGDRGLRQGPPSVREAIPGTRWEVAYWALSGGLSESLTGLLIVGGSAAVVYVLLLYLLLRWFGRVLREDQVLLLGAVRDGMAGRPAERYEIQLKECVPALAGIRRLFGGGPAIGTGAIERAVSHAAARSAPAASDAAAVQAADDAVLAAPVLDPDFDPAAAGEKVSLDPAIFRAYDIRGLVDRNLSPSVVYQIGRAIGSEARARGESTLVVGRDGRQSSPDLAAALIRGVRASGVGVKDIGEVPTPVLYFAAEYLDTRSGVMVTGSHNPPEYNGLKIVLAGETLSGDGIQALRERIERDDLAVGSGELEAVDVVGDYIERIRSDVQLVRPLKVVVDCGNGIAGAVAPQLFEALGCEVVPLFCDVDGRFPNHHPDPSRTENLAALIQAVREQDADIGIAFDGDGDRIGVVASGGEIIWPDRLLMLYAMDVLGRNPGAEIIYDVKSSRHLAKIIRDFGGIPEMWKTGHSFIKARMKETGALLAGEMSGHIFFAERWFGFDDGLYAAARLFEILANDHRSSSKVFGALPDAVSTPELGIALAEGQPQALMERILAEHARFLSDGEVTTIDGIRADFPEGWGLVRASNTTPSLVLRFEADDEAALARIQGRFRALLHSVDPNLDLPF